MLAPNAGDNNYEKPFTNRNNNSDIRTIRFCRRNSTRQKRKDRLPTLATRGTKLSGLLSYALASRAMQKCQG